MRVSPTWRTGEQGVSRFEQWCTERLWPLVRVPTERDLGIDAFVQVTDDDGVATGDVFAVQVKAGASYLRTSSASVPVGGHGDLWRKASLPVLVVVHDPKRDELWWANASEALRLRPDLSTISAEHRLPAEDEDVIPLLRSVRLSADFQSGLPSGLGSTEADEQSGAVWQCFALGFVSAHALIALRRVFSHFDHEAVVEAVVALSHCTPHPDIFWSSRNLLPAETLTAVAKSFRWTVDEVRKMIATIDENNIDRGSIGQCVYMLIFEDPNSASVLRAAALAAVAADDETTAGWATYLAVVQAPDQVVAWEELRQEEPLLAANFGGEYIDQTLRDVGYLTLD